MNFHEKNPFSNPLNHLKPISSTGRSKAGQVYSPAADKGRASSPPTSQIRGLAGGNPTEQDG